MQCVANACGVELATLVKDYKYSVFGGKIAVVEGHSGIVDYRADRVTFAVRGANVDVCGENLRIKCLERGFAVVEGDVSSVEVRSGKSL